MTIVGNFFVLFAPGWSLVQISKTSRARLSIFAFSDVDSSPKRDASSMWFGEKTSTMPCCSTCMHAGRFSAPQDKGAGSQMIRGGSGSSELVDLNARSSETRSVMFRGLSRKWKAFDDRSGVFSRLLMETCKGAVVYLNVLAEDC
jgi:hypothetical protein